MKLVSVNIGSSQPLEIGNHVSNTGIFKMPISNPVRVGKLGLESDVIQNKKHHGGVDQAVYVYGTADYAWWSEQLQSELEPGMFGENLTISDLESARFNIGDRLKIGTVLLEVSASRIPCSTLAARMGDSGFVKKFKQARRPGLYCRVITEGKVQVGDTVTLEPSETEYLSVVDTFDWYYDPNPSLEMIERVLAAPVAIRARKMYQDLLEQREAKGSILLEKAQV
jgi:MOSC domain-containing protein YiiM